MADGVNSIGSTPTSPAPDAPAAPVPEAPSRSGKRNKTLGILLVVFLLGAIAGGFWWHYLSQFEQTDDATLTGHIHPISPRINGTVQSVLVQDNQLVREGQLLASVDPRDYEVALSQAEHNLLAAQTQAKAAQNNIRFAQKQAQSQLTEARGTIGASQAGIAQSQAGVSEARAAVATARQAVAEQEANYQRAQADYRRYRGADPEAISAQQVDLAATNVRVAEAARNSAQAGLAQAQARLAQAQTGVSSSVSKLTQSQGTLQGAQAQGVQIAMARSQYESAQAAIATAQDAVRQAKLNLAYTRILAPVAGRVGNRNVEVGQRIQPGQPLMSVVEPNVWVVANFKETQLQRMRPGQRVDVRIDAFPDHVFTGRVESFSPASGAQFALLPPENATGNFTKIVQRIPVRILLDPRTTQGYVDLLAPGMSVVVKVHVGEG